MICANCGKGIAERNGDWVHETPVIPEQPYYCFEEPEPPLVAEPDD